MHLNKVQIILAYKQKTGQLPMEEKRSGNKETYQGRYHENKEQERKKNKTIFSTIFSAHSNPKFLQESILMTFLEVLLFSTVIKLLYFLHN